jgi:bacteriocin biosynthesis cyclodehydratase domain-containing protein
MTSPDTTLFASPQWTLFMDAGRLFASAGADEMYLLDSLNATQAEKLLQAYRDGRLDRVGDEDPAFALIVAQLLDIGALFRGRSAPLARMTLALRWCGEPLSGFRTGLLEYFPLKQQLLERQEMRPDEGEADLCLIVRTNGSLAQAAEVAADVQTPHLLVDLAYQHTLSLGPLVKRGQTACLACFAGRIIRHWGDQPVPQSPGMLEHHRLAASLTALQIQRFQRFGTCPELIERLWSMDLHSLSSRFDALHRLPWCPQCFPDQTAMDKGRLPLPWI